MRDRGRARVGVALDALILTGVRECGPGLIVVADDEGRRLGTHLTAASLHQHPTTPRLVPSRN